MSTHFYSSDLICSCCGKVYSVLRRKNARREKYSFSIHECSMCQKKTVFIELVSADVVKKDLEFKPFLNEKEQFIHDLLYREDEKQKVLVK